MRYNIRMNQAASNEMARCALIYEAIIVKAKGKMAVGGSTFGIIDGEPVDGDRLLSDYIKNAWLDGTGISFVDAQGREYLILSFDDHQAPEGNGLSDFLALTLLNETANHGR
jgi:hypothetical protein